MTVREAPTPIPDSEKWGSEVFRDFDLGMPIPHPRLEMRSGGDRKMSYSVAFCLGIQEIWVEWGISAPPVLLFQDEEAGSHTGGKQCAEWS